MTRPTLKLCTLSSLFLLSACGLNSDDPKTQEAALESLTSAISKGATAMAGNSVEKHAAWLATNCPAGAVKKTMPPQPLPLGVMKVAEYSKLLDFSSGGPRGLLEYARNRAGLVLEYPNGTLHLPSTYSTFPSLEAVAERVEGPRYRLTRQVIDAENKAAPGTLKVEILQDDKVLARKESPFNKDGGFDCSSSGETKHGGGEREFLLEAFGVDAPREFASAPQIPGLAAKLRDLKTTPPAMDGTDLLRALSTNQGCEPSVASAKQIRPFNYAGLGYDPDAPGAFTMTQQRSVVSFQKEPYGRVDWVLPGSKVVRQTFCAGDLALSVMPLNIGTYLVGFDPKAAELTGISRVASPSFGLSAQVTLVVDSVKPSSNGWLVALSGYDVEFGSLRIDTPEALVVRPRSTYELEISRAAVEPVNTAPGS